MSDWKGKFEPLTKGGYKYEIFAERGGRLYGVCEGYFTEHIAASWNANGQSSSPALSLIPKHQPLRVEDVPLGFPCKLKKTGKTFTPHFISQTGVLWGNCGGFNSAIDPEDIDPDSIIETREVWLTVYPHLYGCNNYVGGCSTSEDTAKKHVFPSGFVYGPIRIPVKPLPENKP